MVISKADAIVNESIYRAMRNVKEDIKVGRISIEAAGAPDWMKESLEQMSVLAIALTWLAMSAELN